MCKAKICLNASPQFFSGSHERVFASMLNRAACVTSESKYYLQHFKQDRHYIGFELETFPETIEKIRNILSSKKKLDEISREGRAIAVRDHT